MILRIVAFVVPLGFDTFAVAVALGLRGVSPLRAALAFALFEAIMPLAGLLIGHVVGQRFETVAVIGGAIVLFGLGMHTLREAFDDDDEAQHLSFSSIRSTMLAGIAISTDELAIGFPMGVSGLPIPGVIAAIALQAFVATLLGIALGRRLGRTGGKRTSRAALIAASAAFMILAVYLIVERFVPGLPPV